MTFTFQQILLVLAGGFVALLLPGLAVRAWLSLAPTDPLESLADTIGLSIAVIALLALAFFFAGLHLNGPSLAGLAGLLALLAVLGVWVRKVRLHPSLGVLLALLFSGLVVAWRLVQANGLVLPPWVDPLHHVLIVRVILEQGGLPNTLAPYLDVPFYYHYGYHAAAAVFTAVSGLVPAAAALLFGQVLNAAISLSIYRLGKAIWRRWQPALAAALLSAFALHMPGYYLTWGRFTLLAGLVLLPLAMAAALEVVHGATQPASPLDPAVPAEPTPPARRGQPILLALLTAGVLLTHYQAALLLALFYILIGLNEVLRAIRNRRLNGKLWLGLLGGALVGALLALPWILRILQYSRLSTSVSLELGNASASLDYQKYLLYLIGPKRNYYLLGLGGIGLLNALRRPAGRLIALWGLLLTLLSLPWGVRLGPFRPDNMAIVLFLPAALLAADLLLESCAVLGKYLDRGWQIAAVLLTIGGLCLWGMRETQHILNPVTLLADSTDLEALNWIKKNTPKDARFFINTTYWQDNMYRGVDGGAWILPITGRWSLIPTEFYGFGSAASVTQINEWASAANQLSTCSTQFWDLVNRANLDYVYIKEGSGSLKTLTMDACHGVEAVYQKNRVSVYHLIPPTGAK